MATTESCVPHVRLVKSSLSPYLLKFRGRRLLKRLLRDPQVSVLDFSLSPGSSSPCESAKKTSESNFIPGHVSVTVCLHGEPLRVPVVTLILDEMGSDGEPLPRPSPEEMDAWLYHLHEGRVVPLRHVLVIRHRPLEKAVRRATETEAWFKPYSLKVGFLGLPGERAGETTQGFLVIESDGGARLWGFGYDASTLTVGAKRRADRWKLLAKFRLSSPVNDVADLRAFTSGPSDSVTILWIKAPHKASERGRRRRKSILSTSDILGFGDGKAQVFTTQITLLETPNPEVRKRSSSWDLQSPGSGKVDFVSEAKRAELEQLGGQDVENAREATEVEDSFQGNDGGARNTFSPDSGNVVERGTHAIDNDQYTSPEYETQRDMSFPLAVRSPQLFGTPSVASVGSANSSARGSAAPSYTTEAAEVSPELKSRLRSDSISPQGSLSRTMNGASVSHESSVRPMRLMRESSLPLKESDELVSRPEANIGTWEGIRACLDATEPAQLNLESLRLIMDPPYIGPVEDDMLLFRQTLTKQSKDDDSMVAADNERVRFGNASSMSTIPAGSVACMIDDGAWTLTAESEEGSSEDRNSLGWTRASYISLSRRRTVHVSLTKEEMPAEKLSTFYPCIFVSRGGLAVSVWESGHMLLLLHEKGDSDVRKWTVAVPQSSPFEEALRQKEEQSTRRKLHTVLLHHTIEYRVWDERDGRTKEGHMLCCALVIPGDKGEMFPLYFQVDCSSRFDEEVCVIGGDPIAPQDAEDKPELRSLMGRFFHGCQPSLSGLAPCALDLHVLRLPKPSVEGTESIGDALSQVRTVNKQHLGNVQQVPAEDPEAWQAKQLQRVVQLDRPGLNLDVLQLLSDESSDFFAMLVNAMYERRTSAFIPFLLDVTEIRCRVSSSADRQALRDALFVKALAHLPKWDSHLRSQPSTRTISKLQSSVQARLLLHAGLFCQCGAILAIHGDHRNATTLAKAWACELRASILRRPYVGKFMLLATHEEECLAKDVDEVLQNEAGATSEMITWWRSLQRETIVSSCTSRAAFVIHALVCTIWSRLLTPLSQKQADAMGARGRSFLHQVRIDENLKSKVLERLRRIDSQALLNEGEFQALCSVDRRSEWFNRCGIDNGVLEELSQEQMGSQSDVPAPSVLCTLACTLDEVVRETTDSGVVETCVTPCGERAWWVD